MSTEDQSTRLERAKVLAGLIADGKFDEAAIEIRPKGAISAGSDTLPEGIARYFLDQKIRDVNFLIAVVEDVVMGYYPKTVIPDMASIGYKVKEAALNKAAKGCRAYSDAIGVCKYGDKYQINTCPCCERMRGKAFSLSDAKIGKTLPPFSKDCRAFVGMAR